MSPIARIPARHWLRLQALAGGNRALPDDKKQSRVYPCDYTKKIKKLGSYFVIYNPKYMQKIKETLQKTGLSYKEIAVYLALLQLNTDSVLNIAKKSNVKRPTCYLILEDLLSKGMVSVVKTKGGVIYKTSNPEILLNKLKIRQKEIEEIMPQLKALSNISQDKPKIEVFEDKEGINTVYQIIAHEAKEILYWGRISPIYQEYKWILDKTQELFLKKKLKVKDLLSNDPIDIELAKKRVSQGFETKISNKKPFSNDNAIFGNKIAIFSFKQDALFAILIQSKEIADSFRSLYELAWESAIYPDEL